MDVEYSRDMLLKLGDAVLFDNTAGVYIPKIKFEFVVESKYHRYLRDEYSSTTQVRFVKSFRSPTRHIATATVSLEAIRSAVDEATHNLMERSERERLAEFACEEVSKRVGIETSLLRRYRNLTLSIKVCIINGEYYGTARLLEMHEKRVAEKYRLPSCIICFEDLRKPREFRLPCLHVFHKDCIIKWLHINEKTTCPICRAKTAIFV